MRIVGSLIAATKQRESVWMNWRIRSSCIAVTQLWIAPKPVLRGWTQLRRLQKSKRWWWNARSKRFRITCVIRPARQPVGCRAIVFLNWIILQAYLWRSVGLRECFRAAHHTFIHELIAPVCTAIPPPKALSCFAIAKQCQQNECDE